MISIYCPHCHKHTALSVARAEYEADYGRVYTTPAIWKTDTGHRWWIGVCNGCRTPCLVLDEGSAVYPDPAPSPTDSHVPKDLAADLDEAKKCFSVSCYRASTAMARRVVQLACVQKGAKKTNLIDQIAELSASGVITKDIEEWATVVRWIGNDAAHPNKDVVTKEDAEDCLKLAEQFLHVLFVTTAIAKARRAIKGK